MYTGIDLLLYLQDYRLSAPEIIDNFFHLISHPFLTGLFPVLMMAVVYWCYDKRAGTYLAFNIFAIGICTHFLKLVLYVPRPWILEPSIHPTAEAISGAGGFSCPSGHTTAAVAFFGSFAVLFRKLIVLPVLCLIAILSIGFSRMYLGVHTPLDVLLGLILAACMLWINWHLLTYMDRNPQKDRLVVLGIMGTSLLLTAGVFFRSYPEIAGVGPNVVANAFTSFFLPIGWFCGFLLGWLTERRKIHFTIPHEILPRVIRSLLGLMLLLGLQAGFGVCLPPLLGTDMGMFVSCFLLGLFISAGYPWFLRFILGKIRFPL